MIDFVRCVQSDFIKTKRESIRLAHILIPLGLALAFLIYYAYVPRNPFVKLEAYFQVMGIGFPFLIGLFCSIIAEQEQNAGNFWELLSSPKRVPVFFSKLFLLIGFGTFSILFASLFFGVGYLYILKQDIVPILFYIKGGFILLGSSIFLYVLHLFLSLRFNKGVSIGVAVLESLVSALFLTGMGEVIWSYTPCAWAARFVTYALVVQTGQNLSFKDCQIAILLCIIMTVVSFVLYGIWAYNWEGQNTSD